MYQEKALDARHTRPIRETQQTGQIRQNRQARGAGENRCAESGFARCRLLFACRNEQHRGERERERKEKGGREKRGKGYQVQPDRLGAHGRQPRTTASFLRELRGGQTR
jgi:hypothetical protein